MSIEFAKLHALGNDFLVVAAGGEEGYRSSLSELARRMCSRHLGIGADGILFYHSTINDPEADYSTLIFNSDGSRAEMSGNGVRCLAAHLRRKAGNAFPPLRIRTVAGIKVLTFLSAERATFSFESSMGAPILDPARIPVRLPPGHDNVADFPLRAGADLLQVSASSMGNPHCTTFWEDVSTAPVTDLGPIIEGHEIFPKRANVEFVQVLGRSRMRVRFWERGVGPTHSSGTGSSAAAVAAILRDKVDRRVTIETDLGTLEVRWAEGEELFLTGTATFVCHGEYLDEIP